MQQTSPSLELSLMEVWRWCRLTRCRASAANRQEVTARSERVNEWMSRRLVNCKQNYKVTLSSLKSYMCLIATVWFTHRESIKSFCMLFRQQWRKHTDRSRFAKYCWTKCWTWWLVSLSVSPAECLTDLFTEFEAISQNKTFPCDSLSWQHTADHVLELELALAISIHGNILDFPHEKKGKWYIVELVYEQNWLTYAEHIASLFITAISQRLCWLWAILMQYWVKLCWKVSPYTATLLSKFFRKYEHPSFTTTMGISTF